MIKAIAHSTNPTTMVVTQARNPAHSTLNGNSESEDMSRMQQDLAASRQSSIESASNGSRETMLRRVLSNGRKPHVCVIGAGFAGLRCADVLLKMGMNVTIFEARGRFGGRVSLLDWIISWKKFNDMV
jgi:alanine dehydrogenase